MKRRKWSAEEKMNIVIEGLKGEQSVAEICRQHNISQILYYRWKDEFIQGGMGVLSGKQRKTAKEDAAVQAKLDEYEKLIGKLTVKISTLKKRSTSEQGALGMYL
ncbi:transposase [Aneurinibacillus aneurinilyticus]|jgi:transposase-like protein|nr:transposase [Aneurinibacillus aneurinilyticus]MED0709850.1 transposase [Aneurinibacillus aneurinilyticus]MED0726118.1 transposase [Aneurinibacillus aneurinilyticus]MED0734951.1 transposase [Aneurinibacillus aneurinilyticus]